MFLGGFIVPGVQTSLRAISAGTAQLPPIAPEPPEHLIGANTVAALNNGAMFGTAAMLDGLADRVEAELGQPLTVVATGGLAPYIMPCCKRKIIYDADLLFKGLALIWDGKESTGKFFKDRRLGFVFLGEPFIPSGLRAPHRGIREIHAVAGDESACCWRDNWDAFYTSHGRMMMTERPRVVGGRQPLRRRGSCLPIHWL